MQADVRRLLERDADLARILEARAALVLVEGPAGIGKSALLDAACARRDDALVLRARGGELERSVPFSVAQELLLPQLVARDPTGAIEGAARDAAGPLGLVSGIPEMRGLLGLTLLCGELADERPVVLAVDDAHWADDATLRWLAFLTARLDDVPVTVLAATRPVTAGGEGEALVPLLRNAVRVAPRALSTRAVADMVREREPRASVEFVTACSDLSSGNPFLVGEILRACATDAIPPDEQGARRLGEMAPRTLAGVTVTRLLPLDEESRRLARAVSMLGNAVPVPRAAKVSGLSIEEAERAADRLSTAGVLADSRPLEFVHPLVRSVVAQDISRAERSRWHRLAADALAGEGAPIAAQAAHLLSVDPAGDAGVVGRLMDAAHDARDRGARTEVVRFLQRALEEPPDVTRVSHVRLHLLRARLHAGEATAGPALLDAIAAVADPVERAAAAVDLIPTPPHHERIHALWDALAAELEDPELALMLAGCARLEPAEATVARLVKHCRLPGETQGEQLVLGLLAARLLDLGEVPAGDVLGLLRRAWPVDGVNAILSGADANGRADMLWAFVFAGALEDAHRRLQQSMRIMRDQGAEFPFVGLYALEAEIAWRRGDLAAMEEAAAAATALAGRQPGLTGVLGDHARARARLARLHRYGTADPCAAGGEMERAVAGEAAISSGDTSSGVELLQAFGASREAEGQRNPARWPWRAVLAPALSPVAAAEMIDVGLDRSRRFGSPLPQAQLERAAALVHRDDPERSEEHLRRAVDLAGTAGAHYELARSQTDLGALLRRTGRRAEARELLRDALDRAARCGAQPLIDRARDELLATGARPRSILRTGVEALTPMERRVARLASHGRTNREIASELFLSLRTIEMHLSNAYRKLDVSSRRELPEGL